MSVLLRIILVALIFVLVGCAAVRITSESGHAEDVSVSEIIGEPLWIPAHSFDERSFPRNQFIGDLKQVTLFKSVAVYDSIGSKTGYLLESYNDVRSPGGMFPCGEPIHVIITLGIVPVVM